MIPLVFLGLLACISAAPHYHHHGPPPPFHDHSRHQKFFHDDIFDTRSFWDELRRDLLSIETVFDDFVKHFPSSVSSEAIEGDIYKITIPLPGFEEKDIVVKAKKGLAMIQAVHKYGTEGSEKTYMDIRSLPNCVNETGQWLYENDVLKIEFPLIGKKEVPSTISTQAPPLHSREEMEPNNENTNQNADTGADIDADRGDLGKENEILTNIISKDNGAVEATTYAVDLKDEYEFVPVRQVK